MCFVIYRGLVITCQLLHYLPLGFPLVNGGVFDSEKLDEEEELIVDSDKSD